MAKGKKKVNTVKQAEVIQPLIVIPPDGGYGWVIVMASFVCNFLQDGTMYSYGLFLKEIAASFDTTETTISLANSLMTGFVYLFGPIICSIINRLGYRLVGFIGGLLASCCFMLSSFASDVSILIFSHGIIGGLGFGMLYMPSVIAVGFYFDRCRGVATSIALCGSSAGSILFPQIILVLLKSLEWRNKFRCFAVLALFCALCTLLYKPLEPMFLYPDEDDDNFGTLSEEETLRYNTLYNKFHNENYAVATEAPKQTFKGPSLYSFKSILSQTRSGPKASRFIEPIEIKSKKRSCSHCCENCNEDCKITCNELCCCCCGGKRLGLTASRPMYRDDILYSASISALPHYVRKSFIDAQSIDYHMSVTRLVTDKDLIEDTKCMCCPESIKRTLSTMLDFGLLKSPSFLMVSLSGFLTMLGYYIPIIYITDRCTSIGMEANYTMYLISSIGLANLFGRILSGILTLIPHMKSLPVTIFSLFVSGLLTMGSSFFVNHIAQFTYCSLYGSTTGPIICSVVNRLGYRLVGFTGGVLASGCFILSSFVQDVSILIFSHGLIGGIGFGMLYMPSVIAVGFYFERWRGVATSMALFGTAAGSIFFPQIILVLLKSLEWRNKFRCFAGAALFCALCTLLFKPLEPIFIYADDEEPEHASNEDKALLYNTMYNKYHNESYPTSADIHTPSYKNVIRTTSPNAISAYSFKSFFSYAHSLPSRSSRYMDPMDIGVRRSGAQCCQTCKENCRTTCYDLCCCCCGGKRVAMTASRPMYRDDILYSASIATLPQYVQRSVADTQSIDYHMSVTRIVTERDLIQDTKCMCCPESVKRTLSTMLDFGLLKSPSFLLVSLSGFLTMLGYYIPIIYITDRCKSNGMEEKYTGYLISSIGIANLIGRIICGIVTFFPQVKALPATTASLFISGIVTIGSVFFVHYIAQFTYCSLYGSTAALVLSLRPILIVELFSLEKLSNSFGLLMMFQGMACLIGLPMAGLLYDLTKSYKFTFFFAGGAITLSGVLLLPVNKLLKYEDKKMKQKRQAELEAAKQKATTSKPNKPGYFRS